jgi:hypothetical protein
LAGPNNFRKEFGKRISKKRKGELFTGGPAPTNRPSQRSQPRPTAPRPPPPRARSDTAAPRAPDRVRPTAPRGRHALLAGATTPPSAADSATSLAILSSTRCAPPRSLSRSPASSPRAPCRRSPLELPELRSPCSRHSVASQRLLPPLRAPHSSPRART